MYPRDETVVNLVRTLKLYLTYEGMDGRVERKELRKDLKKLLIKYDDEGRLMAEQAYTDAINGK